MSSRSERGLGLTLPKHFESHETEGKVMSLEASLIVQQPCFYTVIPLNLKVTKI